MSEELISRDDIVGLIGERVSDDAWAERSVAAIERAAAEKALTDAAEAFDGGTISLDVFSNEVEKSYWRVANEQRSILVDSLRARAAEYRKEQSNE